MGIIAAIQAAFGAIGAGFTWALHRSGLRNNPSMQAADEAQKQQDLKDQIARDILRGNINDLRKRGSQ